MNGDRAGEASSDLPASDVAKSYPGGACVRIGDLAAFPHEEKAFMKDARWLTSSPHRGLPHMRDAQEWLKGLDRARLLPGAAGQQRMVRTSLGRH